MLAKLVNDAKLSFLLCTDGPVLINNPAGSKINPTLSDMSFVRCKHNGIDTVYLPGSSIKGVFRSRYEQLMYAMNKSVCNLFDKENCCSKKIGKVEKSIKKVLDGKQRYNHSCAACRFFGNLSLGSRVSFADAYPAQESSPTLGMRHGVGIDRITGAAKPSALFDFEVVEDGVFELEIRITNFALYQLRLLTWIIQDIDDGIVTFGMGGSRGNGQMRLVNKEDMQMQYRLYDSESTEPELRGYMPSDVGVKIEYKKDILCRRSVITGLENIIKSTGISTGSDLQNSMDREEWDGLWTDRKHGRG